MKRKYLAFALFLSLPAIAAKPSLIVCEPQDKSSTTSSEIWPAPYLDNSQLCFNMQADKGSTCVGNGQTTQWMTEAVIVDIGGEPQGRDDTWFRVVQPVVNDKEIAYKIEGSRDQKTWGLVSNVEINRLTGGAVDWFVAEHGGTAYQCHLEGPKI
ncbi:MULTISPECIES: hypothetical protein [Enterobacteriaceae]|uniref:hypothetical protein n=1 Tax=Enterobacteriaceae TaxID=543 RepID=UPI000272AB4B|nr:hypothetical protein [Enterobacter sp. Ag1]EJF32552.1 hypothetical protein A936_02633 [Enterobacter sp. Ag1]